MIKLTRLNHHLVALNPDHIRWAEASPDTTLFLLGGEKMIVLETLDELMERVVEFRQRIRASSLTQPQPGASEAMDTISGDPPRVFSNSPGARLPSTRPPRPSNFPRSGGQ